MLNKIKDEYVEAQLAVGKWHLLERIHEAEEKALSKNSVQRSFAKVAQTLEGRSKMEELIEQLVARQAKKVVEDAVPAGEDHMELEEERFDRLALKMTKQFIAKVHRRRTIAAEAKQRRETQGKVKVPIGEVINTGELLAAEERKLAEEEAARKARIQEHQTKVAELQELRRTTRMQLEEATTAHANAEMELEDALAEKERRVGRGSALWNSRKPEAKRAREEATAMVAEKRAAKTATGSKKRKLAASLAKHDSEMARLEKVKDPGQAPTARRATKRHKANPANDIYNLEDDFDVGSTSSGQTVASILRQDQGARAELLTDNYGHRWRKRTGRAWFPEAEADMEGGLEFIVSELEQRLRQHTQHNIPAALRDLHIWKAIEAFTRENLPHGVTQLQQQGFLVDVGDANLLKVSAQKFWQHDITNV